MPIAKFKCVREVTSEDSHFPAENLLKEEGKEWKTKAVGEKLAYVILELENPVQIIGIDIGNEHSAFVEVLVSNGCRPENFTEILITLSFMTPVESKNSSNRNRVRCFNKDALVAPIASQKWNMVKILCAQPFNKHVQYGLSFIKIHTPDIGVSKNKMSAKKLVPKNILVHKENDKNHDETRNREKNTSRKTKTIANFFLKEESLDSESESSETLFNRWKKNHENIFPTTASAIRQTSDLTSSCLRKSIERVRTILPIMQKDETKQNQPSELLDRNRTDLVFGPEDENVNEDKRLQKLSKHIQKDQKRLVVKKEGTQKQITSHKKSDRLSTQSYTNNKFNKRKQKILLNEKGGLSSSKKRASLPNGGPTKKLKTESPIVYRPFNQLFRDIVIVISGIQNPDRANLREKALAMGAKYKTDWGPDCTHLISAFKNTPKYNQVKGIGKIVKRQWIEECFDKKKYLPWCRYALENDNDDIPDSDTEIWDTTFKEILDKGYNDQMQLDSDNCVGLESSKDKLLPVDSGSDTDEQIQRIMQKNENRCSSEENNVYEATTEEEEYIRQKHKKSNISFTFFYDIIFFIATDLTQGNRAELQRCIKNHGGSFTQKICEADVIIAESLSDLCKSVKFKGEVVRPHWVLECNDMEKKIAMSPFKITKN